MGVFANCLDNKATHSAESLSVLSDWGNSGGGFANFGCFTSVWMFNGVKPSVITIDMFVGRLSWVVVLNFVLKFVFRLLLLNCFIFDLKQ